MSSRHWGTFYLVHPSWDPDSDESDDGIVSTYSYGRSHIAVASELWRLAEDANRADQIEQLVDRAYGRNPHILDERDIEELLQLLDGLEARLVATTVDDRWNVRPEDLPALRRRTTMLDLEDRPGAVPEAGVAAGISRVVALRNILQLARSEHLHIAMD